VFGARSFMNICSSKRANRCVPNPITLRQTWSLTEREKRIIHTCQWKMERRILQVVWSTEWRKLKYSREPAWVTYL